MAYSVQESRGDTSLELEIIPTACLPAAVVERSLSLKIVLGLTVLLARSPLLVV